MAERWAISDQDVLIVIDVQNDFCPGGALAVEDGDKVVAPINRLGRLFAHVVMTQDWHPPGHLSFASAHPGRQPFDAALLPYGEQTLWPDHCVQATEGAAFHRDLSLPHCELILRKGFRRAIDSYSAFTENDRTTPTGLAGYLRERGFRRIVLAGLATDYCVAYSAMDACRHGFAVAVVADACRAIRSGAALDAVITEMRQAGADIVGEDALTRAA